MIGRQADNLTVIGRQADDLTVTDPVLSRKIIAALFASIVLLGFVPHDRDVPMDVQYPLFLKILTFDRNLPKRAGTEIVIGVLFQERVRQSWLAKDEFMRAVKKSAIKRIHDRPVQAVPIAYDRIPSLPEALANHEIDVLYVAPLRAADLEEIVQVVRSRKILTLTGIPEYVEGGLSIGIGLDGDSPEILVNLSASRAEGANLHAQLLRLARLVEE